jgi:hypothetical protein
MDGMPTQGDAERMFGELTSLLKTMWAQYQEGDSAMFSTMAKFNELGHEYLPLITGHLFAAHPDVAEALAQLEGFYGDAAH